MPASVAGPPVAESTRRSRHGRSRRLGAGGPPATDGRRPLVVDFTAMWAGPLCAHLLARSGARVVTVESIDRPDGARIGDPRLHAELHRGHDRLLVDFAMSKAGGGSATGGVGRRGARGITAPRSRRSRSRRRGLPVRRPRDAPGCRSPATDGAARAPVGWPSETTRPWPAGWWAGTRTELRCSAPTPSPTRDRRSGGGRRTRLSHHRRRPPHRLLDVRGERLRQSGRTVSEVRIESNVEGDGWMAFCDEATVPVTRPWVTGRAALPRRGCDRSTRTISTP